MTPSSPSVSGLIVWNLPSSTCKKPSEWGNFSLQKQNGGSECRKREQTQLLATVTVPSPDGPQDRGSRQAQGSTTPGRRGRAPEQPHISWGNKQGLYPWLHPAGTTHLTEQENTHTRLSTPEMKPKLAFIHILKRHILSLTSNSTRPRFKQHW